MVASDLGFEKTLVKRFQAFETERKSGSPSEEDIKAFRALRGVMGPSCGLADDGCKDWHRRGVFLVEFPSIGAAMADPPQTRSRGVWVPMREVLNIVQLARLSPVVFDGLFKGEPALFVLWLLRYGPDAKQEYHVSMLSFVQ